MLAGRFLFQRPSKSQELTGIAAPPICASVTFHASLFHFTTAETSTRLPSTNAAVAICDHLHEPFGDVRSTLPDWGPANNTVPSDCQSTTNNGSGG